MPFFRNFESDRVLKGHDFSRAERCRKRWASAPEGKSSDAFDSLQRLLRRDFLDCLSRDFVEGYWARRVKIEDERNSQFRDSFKQGGIQCTASLPVFRRVTAGQPSIVSHCNFMDDIELWFKHVKQPFEMVLQGQMVVERTIQKPNGSPQLSCPGIFTLAFSFESRVSCLQTEIPIHFVGLKGVAIDTKGGFTPSRIILLILFIQVVNSPQCPSCATGVHRG